MPTDQNPRFPPATDASTIAALVEVSLEVLHREYPNYVQHLMLDDTDAVTPQNMKPAFFGCFDWHSAVHNHWALVRVLRLYPELEPRDRILAALQRSFTADKLQGEFEYISCHARNRFEMPYGAAWLLLLCAELREAGETLTGSETWLRLLGSLEALFAERFFQWLDSLPVPIRSGEHSQSAFAMGLVDDWAVLTGRSDMRELIASKARQFYLTDRPWPFRLEPSAYDFLSPGLSAADLLRRVLDGDDYRQWLSEFLPTEDILADNAWLEPVAPADPSDGKLSHWSGLNLSRAWMLAAIASDCGSPELAQKLCSLSQRHQSAGLTAIETAEYAGTHWLVSFTIYLLTARWEVSPPAANRV